MAEKKKTQLLYEVVRSESGTGWAWKCRVCGEVESGWDYRVNAVAEARSHVYAQHGIEPSTRYVISATPFTDGGGVVTGTHDVEAARKLMIDACAEDKHWSWDGLTDQEREEAAREMFPIEDARCEWGRKVPVGPGSWLADEFSWVWLPSKYAPGVSMAVVWHG